MLKLLARIKQYYHTWCYNRCYNIKNHFHFRRSVPAEIGDLTELRELMLNNNLLRTLPPEIGKLFQLLVGKNIKFLRFTIVARIYISCALVLILKGWYHLFLCRIWAWKETNLVWRSPACTMNQTEWGSFWISCSTI